MKHIPFIILSAEHSADDPEANKHATESLARQLAARRLDFVPTRGAYLGVEENSFLVLTPQGEDSPGWDYALSLARRYGQESVLGVCSSRIATLYYLAPGSGGAPVIGARTLGTFERVTPAQAAQLDGWTLYDGQHWAVIRSAPANFHGVS